MLIECSRCHTRYRMNESILEGFTRAEVRCRRCAETIVVLAPMMHVDPPGSADPADRAFADRNPLDPNGKPGPAGRPEDPLRARARRGSVRAEAKARPRPDLEEESSEPVPDNIYSLALFREIRPKRLPTGGFDISGCIRPEPLLLPAERKPAALPQTPDAAPERQNQTRARRFDIPEEWRTKRTAPSAGVPLFASPAETGGPGNPSSRKTRSRIDLFFAENPYLSHIVIVYLIILFMGACGYLIVRFLAHWIAGGSE